MQHGTDAGSEGVEALAVSFGIGAAAAVFVLLLAALLRQREPMAASFFDVLNILIVLTQALDGSTTWIGVTNPFGYDIPTFQETVFVSALVIERFGGFVYFVLKMLLAVGVVLTLGIAESGAGEGGRDHHMVLLVQLSLIVIGGIPVFNNTLNFLAAA